MSKIAKQQLGINIQDASDTPEASVHSALDPGDSVKFLLSEYDRLKLIRDSFSQKASRRFEFYITIVAAIAGAIIVLMQVPGAKNIQEDVLYVVGLALLAYGTITFMNLTFASIWDLQIVRALNEIQRFFIERDPTIEKYLYFKSPPIMPRPYVFFRIFTRGFAGGSEKSVMAIVNSSLASLLIVSRLSPIFINRVTNSQLLLAWAPITVAFGIIHVLYVAFMYKYSRHRR